MKIEIAPVKKLYIDVSPRYRNMVESRSSYFALVNSYFSLLIIVFCLVSIPLLMIALVLACLVWYNYFHQIKHLKNRKITVDYKYYLDDIEYDLYGKKIEG